MDESAGIHPAHRHNAHRTIPTHEMPSTWQMHPNSYSYAAPACYGVPPQQQPPYAGTYNNPYNTPQIIFAPPPPSWYYQNPPGAQPANSFVVYNGTYDGATAGSKNQNAAGGGKTTQKGGGGEPKGHGEIDGDNAEGENAPSKKKGGGGPKKSPPSPIPALLNCLSNPTPHRLHYDLRDFSESASLVNTTDRSQFPIPHPMCSSFITAPNALRKIKLISPLFPWCIDITHNTGITLDILIQKLHESLWDVATTNAEWWATTDEHRTRMYAVYHNNLAATALPPGSHIGYGGVLEPPIRKARPLNDAIRRIDWLLDRTILKGLEKDDEFISIRVQDPKCREETWIVSLGSNCAY